MRYECANCGKYVYRPPCKVKGHRIFCSETCKGVFYGEKNRNMTRKPDFTAKRKIEALARRYREIHM